MKEKAKKFVLTDEYKTLTDEALEQHKKGEAKYLSKEMVFRKLTSPNAVLKS